MRSGVDDEPVDEAGRAAHHEVGGVVASGAITRSTDECEMSRSCQSATSSSAGAGVAAQQRARGRTGSRSGSGSSCAASPRSPSGPCRTAPRPRRPRCAASGGPRSRAARCAVPRSASAAKYVGVAVARDDLGRDRLGREAERCARPLPRPRARRWRRCRPRRRSCRPRSPRARRRAARGARELGVEAGEHQAGGDRLGVDAVRAADASACPCARRRGGGSAASSRSTPASSWSAASISWHRERGVEHVRRGHAEVQPARLGAGQLLDVGQERDHVVAGGLLDLVDPRGIDDRLDPARASALTARPRPPAPAEPRPSPRARRARPRARAGAGFPAPRWPPSGAASSGESWADLVTKRDRPF